MKRFVCFLLTLVLIVSLVPATVLTANAASVLNTSDKAIEILKANGEDAYVIGEIVAGDEKIIIE